METRINKFLTESGICSRREADRWILEKRIKINGKEALIGQKILDNDIITVDGKLIKRQEDFVYLAYHKPIGIISTTDQNIKHNIVDAINYPKRIFHVGRLDKDSSGLILMTSDGDIVNKILRQENNHEKEYIVKVNKPITNAFIKQMANGVFILDKMTKPCKVIRKSDYAFHIIITEGMNRQIRRMCQSLEYEVLSLHRVRIMHIDLDIPVGHYRSLNDEELKTLFKKIEHNT